MTKFAKIEIQDFYSTESSEKILAQLKDIAQKEGVVSPFWNYAASFENERLPYIFDFFIEDNLRVRVGHISSFTAAEIAPIILEQTQIYVEKGTMGKFPKNSEIWQRKLLAAFCESEENRLIISIEKLGEDGQIKPIAGSVIGISNSDIPAIQGALDKTKASLHSLQALDFDDEAITAFSKSVGNTPQRLIAAPMRFWLQDVQKLAEYGILEKDLSGITLALIPFAYAHYAQSQGIEIPHYALVDTHIDRLVGRIEQEYGAQKIATNKNFAPSELISSGVLGYHYGPKGFSKQIDVAVFSSDQFLRKAFDFLTKKGIITHQIRDNAYVRIIDNLNQNLLVEKIKEGYVVSENPYNSALEELDSLLKKFEKISSDKDEVLEQIAKFLNQVSGISEEEIRRVYSKFIASDIALFVSLLRDVKRDEFVWVIDSNARTISKLPNQELWWVLQSSRALGIIPLESLKKLKDAKIVSLGASVAASTIDLLVSMGASNITSYDDGFFDPSNLPRMPHGFYNTSMMSKAAYTMYFCSLRNPFGNYHGIPGRVLLDEKDRVSPFDILLSDALFESDIILEVVDNPAVKLGLRKELKNFPDKNVVFIADLGANSPLVALENANLDSHFATGMNQHDVDVLMSGLPQNTFTAIYQMIGEDFSVEHLLAYMTNGAIKPFLSQTALSARTSAAMAVLDIIILASGISVEVLNTANSYEDKIKLLTGYDDTDYEIAKKLAKGYYKV